MKPAERVQTIAWLSIRMPRERLQWIIGRCDVAFFDMGTAARVRKAARYFEVTEFEVGMRVGILMQSGRWHERGRSMVKLGSRVKDTITGFEGIATGRNTFLNGCVSVAITLSQLTKDGEPKTEWFDEQRVKVIEADAFEAEPTEATAGGPHSIPPPDGAR